jgi:hypothetical protein
VPGGEERERNRGKAGQETARERKRERQKPGNGAVNRTKWNGAALIVFVVSVKSLKIDSEEYLLPRICVQ